MEKIKINTTFEVRSIGEGEESESEGLCIPDLPGYPLFAG